MEELTDRIIIITVVLASRRDWNNGTYDATSDVEL